MQLSKKSGNSSTPLSSGSILPRKEPVQDRSRARFEKILEVFRDLTIEKGVDAVSMKEVAQFAKISIASLYQYFPDKAALVATLADRYNKQGEHCVESILSSVKKPTELNLALITMLEEYYAFFRMVPGSYAIWQATQSDVRLHEIDENHCDRVTEILTSTFSDVLPSLTYEQCHHHACLCSTLIAAVVRKAINLPEASAEILIDLYKKNYLSLSIEQVLRG